MLKPAFQTDAMDAVKALAKDTATAAPACSSAPLVQDGALYNAVGAARRRPGAGGELQGRPAQLRRVRREARVRPGTAAGPVQRPRRPHRRSDLRGHLGTRCRVPEETGRRSSSRPTARPSMRPSAIARINVAVARVVESGIAARLSQPGRRPGRAGVRRRLVRAQRRPAPRRANAELGGGRRWSPMARDRRRLALRAGRRAQHRRAVSRAYRGWCSVSGITSTRTAFRRRARSLRRHQLGALRCPGGRRAGHRPRALRDDALALHLRRSLEDAADCAEALGVRYDIVPIAGRWRASPRRCAEPFKGRKPDITEENIRVAPAARS